MTKFVESREVSETDDEHESNFKKTKSSRWKSSEIQDQLLEIKKHKRYSGGESPTDIPILKHSEQRPN